MKSENQRKNQITQIFTVSQIDFLFYLLNENFVKPEDVKKDSLQAGV